MPGIQPINQQSKIECADVVAVVGLIYLISWIAYAILSKSGHLPAVGSRLILSSLALPGLLMTIPFWKKQCSRKEKKHTVEEALQATLKLLEESMATQSKEKRKHLGDQ